MSLFPWLDRHRSESQTPDRSLEVIRVQQETTRITRDIRSALEDLSEIIGDPPTSRKDGPHE